MTSPRSKLQRILECSRCISQELETAAKSSVTDVSDRVYITADEFIGVFNFVLIRSSEALTLVSTICSGFVPADMSTLATQLHYVRHFSSKNDLFGEAGYCSSRSAFVFRNKLSLQLFSFNVGGIDVMADGSQRRNTSCVQNAVNFSFQDEVAAAE